MRGGLRVLPADCAPRTIGRTILATLFPFSHLYSGFCSERSAARQVSLGGEELMGPGFPQSTLDSREVRNHSRTWVPRVQEESKVSPKQGFRTTAVFFAVVFRSFLLHLAETGTQIRERPWEPALLPDEQGHFLLAYTCSLGFGPDWERRTPEQKKTKRKGAPKGNDFLAVCIPSILVFFREKIQFFRQHDCSGADLTPWLQRATRARWVRSGTWTEPPKIRHFLRLFL